MKKVLQLILIETSANCFAFSFLLPALGAQKEGLVLLTQLTWGSAHWENSNFNYMLDSSMIASFVDENCHY
jgi:hypothetical protein